MFFELAKGVSLLLALSFIYSLRVRTIKSKSALESLLTGIVFGAICTIGMLSPLALNNGIIIDARSVILSVSAIFGGAWIAFVATAIAAAARWLIGGLGVDAGLLVIIISSAFGLAYRHLLKFGFYNVNTVSLFIFGLVLHITLLGIFKLISLDEIWIYNNTISIYFLCILSLATVALGLLLHRAEKRQPTKDALTRTASKLSAITQSIPDAMLLINSKGYYIEVLSQDKNLITNSNQHLVGKQIFEFLPDWQAEQFMGLTHEAITTGYLQSIETKFKTNFGIRDYEVRFQSLDIKIDDQPLVLILARDITEQKNAADALRESELRFRTLLRDIPSISVQGYKRDGTTTYWNNASEVLYGYTSEEALGKNILDLIIPPSMHAEVCEEIHRSFTTGQVIPAGELQLQRKNGSLVHVFSSHMLVSVPGQEPEMFCLDIDISRRKLAEEQVHYLAFFDALTQLPNRSLLMERLKKTRENDIHSGLSTAVMLVDLDNFQTLNDTRGHEVGDLLLQRVADSLKKSVRANDTVARLGGDEFVVLLSSLSSNQQEAANQVRAIGEQILSQLRNPFNLDGQEHHFSASIGISLLHQSESVDEVLKQADLAMYRAKSSGRDCLQFFDPDMQKAMDRRAMLEIELHNALREQQFLLLYQPQVDQDGHITGAEALVRWQHPVQGIVSPSEFIPLAETSGLILPLGHWIMETAFLQQSRWRQDPTFKQLNLSINVSARQFLQDDFVTQVLSLLNSSGADPSRIKLELTESLLVHCVETVISKMHELKVHGIEFSLDDFGTGYSSLNYLRRLPLSQIKIDQGFVRGVLQNPNDAVIARTIISLASDLSLNVVAEGVETREHLHFLLNNGCSAFQGYLFGRPMPVDAYELQIRCHQIFTSYPSLERNFIRTDD